MKQLREFDIWWVEEPTCADDILGHRKIKDGLDGEFRMATGEMCQNRVMFKQFMEHGATDVVLLWEIGVPLWFNFASKTVCFHRRILLFARNCSQIIGK